MLKNNDVDGDKKFGLAKARGKRLVAIRELMELNRSQFAEKFGFSGPTLAQWETLKGASPGINEDHAERIARAIEHSGCIVSKKWLLNGTGDPPRLLKPELPVPLNRFHYAVPTKTIRDQLDSMVKKFGNNKFICFRVPDQAMAPIYNRGDYLIGMLTEKENWFELFQTQNKAGIIELGKDNMIVRHIDKTDPNTFILRP